MANVKVNTISKVSGNNVAMQNSLNLKSYSTSARNSLTSAAGDIIYNSDDNKVISKVKKEVNDLCDAFPIYDEFHN